MHKKIAILYHADCPDGFGAAYAAWKKFGDAALYIPVDPNKMPAEDLTGKEVYMADICFKREMMNELMAKAASVTVLDHHEGVRDVIESIPNHVYDKSRSGAVIAWDYFHPGIPTPTFLRYVQEGDLYTFALPDSRPLLAYAYGRDFTFDSWDKLVREMEDEHFRKEAVARGKIYEEYRQILVKQIADRAWPVMFEGKEVLAVDAPRALASDVGHLLAQRKPPLGIVIRVKHDGLRVSLRGDGSVNVAEIAQKYGGNGHPNAAAFVVLTGQALPFS